MKQRVKSIWRIASNDVEGNGIPAGDRNTPVYGYTLFSPDEVPVKSDTNAQKLSTYAFDRGAEEVVHEYNLNAPVCTK